MNGFQNKFSKKYKHFAMKKKLILGEFCLKYQYWIFSNRETNDFKNKFGSYLFVRFSLVLMFVLFYLSVLLGCFSEICLSWV